MAKDQERDAIVQQVVRALCNERKKQQISMNQLAAKAGISQSMVSLVEREKRSPTLDTLLRIAESLEVDLGKIISRARKSTSR